MKRAVVALAAALAAGLVNAAASSNTTIYATPHNGSVAGQTVTFKASFVFPCADGVASHFFVIDTKVYAGQQFTIEGQSASETLTTASLAPGRHAVGYQWSTSVPGERSCSGAASFYYTVSPKPAPPPPSPSPSPSPISSPPSSPPATPPFSGIVSASRIQLAATVPAEPSNYGYLAGLLVALALAAGAGLALLSRR